MAFAANPAEYAARAAAELAVGPRVCAYPGVPANKIETTYKTVEMSVALFRLSYANALLPYAFERAERQNAALEDQPNETPDSETVLADFLITIILSEAKAMTTHVNKWQVWEAMKKR